MESGVEFVAADFPQANRLTIQPQANVFADQSSGGMRLGGVENLTFASPPLLGLSVAIASRFTGLPIPAPPAQPQQRPDATLVALELIKETSGSCSDVSRNRSSPSTELPGPPGSEDGVDDTGRYL